MRKSDACMLDNEEAALQADLAHSMSVRASEKADSGRGSDSPTVTMVAVVVVAGGAAK